MNDLAQYLTWLDKLEGLPGVTLVFFSCIVMGYVWRFIPHKWFPNEAIPIIVILWGCFAFSAIADANSGNVPFRVWFFRNVLVGAVVGFLAWMAHYLIIKRVEDWIGGKFGSKPIEQQKEETKP